MTLLGSSYVKWSRRALREGSHVILCGEQCNVMSAASAGLSNLGMSAPYPTGLYSLFEIYGRLSLANSQWGAGLLALWGLCAHLMPRLEK
jgi:hypothetical protein